VRCGAGDQACKKAADNVHLCSEVYPEPVAITADYRDDLERVFELAVLPERPRLYALALTITRDPAEAEDAVQETMLSAWRSWASLRDPDHPGPWLTRICVNHCLRGRRRLTRWLRAQELREAASPVPIQFDDQLLDFDRAFARLSARQRAVFALHVQHGYTVDECARLIGCRAGTARGHLGRAVAALRKAMSNA
jgi:RNA polymerase sigma factor (sigma-70 family)